MQRVCFLLKVRRERLEEYVERHREVWPEMLDALRETGWHNYSLFLRDDGLLIGYLETPDFQAALDVMAGREVNERWQNDARRPPRRREHGAATGGLPPGLGGPDAGRVIQDL